MKRIKPSQNCNQWPNCPVESVECRPCDLIIRISDWTSQSLESGEPAYDVETYVGGVYSWHDSECLTLRKYKTKQAAKAAAIAFAQKKIAELL